MIMERKIKESFSVIGKEGSTMEGEGFVARLWERAARDFAEVAHLAKKEDDGSYSGFWGAMSDCSRSFRPWEDDFSRGLYLAGVECMPGAEAPEGWTKWTLPGFTYLVTSDVDGAFSRMIRYLGEQGLPLAGAVQEFTDPRTGERKLYFPIQRREECL